MCASVLQVLWWFLGGACLRCSLDAVGAGVSELELLLVLGVLMRRRLLAAVWPFPAVLVSRRSRGAGQRACIFDVHKGGACLGSAGQVAGQGAAQGTVWCGSWLLAVLVWRCRQVLGALVMVRVLFERCSRSWF